jgi:arsenical pump membrane protein
VAAQHARNSPLRLFALIYLLGAVVTALLSNDATAVVLTPAVLAVIRRAKADPRPYLLARAFIANAASFVFPFLIRQIWWFLTSTCHRLCCGSGFFSFLR